MLARLRGMVQALRTSEAPDSAQSELLPTWDAGHPPNASGDGNAVETPPPGSNSNAGEPTTSIVTSESVAALPSVGTDVADVQVARRCCRQCGTAQPSDATYCDNCGWVFPANEEMPSVEIPAGTRLQGRFEVGRRYDERQNIARFRGTDHAAEHGGPRSVVVVRDSLKTASVQPGESGSEAVSGEARDEFKPTAPMELAENAWPSTNWEHDRLQQLVQPFFPRVVEYFRDGDAQYLIQELPTGRLLWDAWDDPEVTELDRFGWLKQIAEALDLLHCQGAILEGLRPDIIIITPEGQARITDLGGLLPLPVPEHCQIRASCYTAPELVLSPEKADARADLFGFGAMVYAMHLGRELTELDFELQGVPKSIFSRFPDIHPDFGRLIGKTFCRDVDGRFPTEDAANGDPTGFKELATVLDSCARSLGHLSIDVGASTTTGMVRTGNEDAFAVFHSAGSFENDFRNRALVLLADGMGGYEAGEVAARMALAAIQEYLSKQEPFVELLRPDKAVTASAASVPASHESYKEMVLAALKEANQRVYTAARSRIGRKGMGCTAEVVFIDGQRLVVGHVGDSRTYHLHAGRLAQVTRDQTVVNRMVDTGLLTPEEAGNHPRRSELYQAIGGHTEVEPALYQCTLRAGDRVLVCSDGLSNQLSDDVIREMLLRSGSAESAARRLVNYANLQGATDNVTAVVVRIN
jgi:protein phosphatase